MGKLDLVLVDDFFCNIHTESSILKTSPTYHISWRLQCSNRREKCRGGCYSLRYIVRTPVRITHNSYFLVTLSCFISCRFSTSLSHFMPSSDSLSGQYNWHSMYRFVFLSLLNLKPQHPQQTTSSYWTKLFLLCIFFVFPSFLGRHFSYMGGVEHGEMETELFWGSWVDQPVSILYRSKNFPFMLSRLIL